MQPETTSFATLFDPGLLVRQSWAINDRHRHSIVDPPDRPRQLQRAKRQEETLSVCNELRNCNCRSSAFPRWAWLVGKGIKTVPVSVRHADYQLLLLQGMRHHPSSVSSRTGAIVTVLCAYVVVLLDLLVSHGNTS